MARRRNGGQRGPAVGRGTEDEKAQRVTAAAQGDVARVPAVAAAADAERTASGQFEQAINELRQLRTELREQREALERARTEVHVERWRYRQLFDCAPIGYVVTDANGTIQDANAAAAALFRARPSFLAGKPLTVFVAREERRAFRRRLMSVQAREQPREWVVTLEPRGGGALKVGVIVTAELEPTGDAVMLRVQMQDITARLVAEDQIRTLNATLEQRVIERTAQLEATSLSLGEALRRERQSSELLEAARRRLAFVADASRELGGSLDPDEAIRHVGGLAVPLLADWTFIDLLTEDGRVQRLPGAHADPAFEDELRALVHHYPYDARSAFCVPRVLRSGEPEIVEEVGDHWLSAAAASEEHLRLLRLLGMGSYLVVPMRVADRVIGALSLVARQPGRYGLAELETAEELAARAALALENARLYAAEHRARRAAELAMNRVARLQSVTAALSSTQTPAETAAVIVCQGVEAVGAAAGMVALVSDDAARLQMVRASGLADDAIERLSPLATSARGPMAQALRTGEATVLAVAELRSRHPDLDADIVPSAWGSIAVLPLILDGRPLGALGFAFRVVREMAADDRAFMVTLAQQCAQAFERVRLNESERVAREEAERANKSKTEFLAMLSHELRTPLTTVGGYAELLEMGVHGPITSAQRDSIERIRRAQTHIAGVLSNVLSFVRAESGRLLIRTGEVEMSQLLGDVRVFVEPLFRVKHLTLEMSEGRSGGTAWGDREKVQQILINLLSNAAKFSPVNGTVAVDWGLAGSRVTVRVRDGGPGISDSDLPRIFEPFYRGSAVCVQEVAGTGLGLAISRDLARLMDGDLTVASVPGAGATFTLTLPAARPADEHGHTSAVRAGLPVRFGDAAKESA